MKHMIQLALILCLALNHSLAFAGESPKATVNASAALGFQNLKRMFDEHQTWERLLPALEKSVGARDRVYIRSLKGTFTGALPKIRVEGDRATFHVSEKTKARVELKDGVFTIDGKPWTYRSGQGLERNANEVERFLQAQRAAQSSVLMNLLLPRANALIIELAVLAVVLVLAFLAAKVIATIALVYGGIGGATALICHVLSLETRGESCAEKGALWPKTIVAGLANLLRDALTPSFAAELAKSVPSDVSCYGGDITLKYKKKDGSGTLGIYLESDRDGHLKSVSTLLENEYGRWDEKSKVILDPNISSRADVKAVQASFTKACGNRDNTRVDRVQTLRTHEEKVKALAGIK